MKRLLFLAALVGAFVTFGTATEASHRYSWGGGYGISGGGHYGGCYTPSYRSYPRAYPTYHRTWHDTSHYDYHPPSLQRHRNHFHYVPGHYDLHRTGHWDVHLHR